MLQNWIAFGHLMRRILRFPPFYKTGFSGFGSHRLAVVLIGIYVDGVAIGHQLKQDFFKILQPVHRFYARYIEGFFFG